MRPHLRHLVKVGALLVLVTLMAAWKMHAHVLRSDAALRGVGAVAAAAAAATAVHSTNPAGVGLSARTTVLSAREIAAQLLDASLAAREKRLRQQEHILRLQEQHIERQRRQPPATAADGDSTRPAAAAPPAWSVIEFPHIVHQTGKTDVLPRVYVPFVASWIRQHANSSGAPWRYRFWTDVANRELVARAFPAYLHIYDALAHPVQRADVVRYALLYGAYDIVPPASPLPPRVRRPHPFHPLHPMHQRTWGRICRP